MKDRHFEKFFPGMDKRCTGSILHILQGSIYPDPVYLIRGPLQAKPGKKQLLFHAPRTDYLLDQGRNFRKLPFRHSSFLRRELISAVNCFDRNLLTLISSKKDERDLVIPADRLYEGKSICLRHQIIRYHNIIPGSLEHLKCILSGMCCINLHSPGTVEKDLSKREEIRFIANVECPDHNLILLMRSILHRCLTGVL